MNGYVAIAQFFLFLTSLSIATSAQADFSLIETAAPKAAYSFGETMSFSAVVSKDVQVKYVRLLGKMEARSSSWSWYANTYCTLVSDFEDEYVCNEHAPDKVIDRDVKFFYKIQVVDSNNNFIDGQTIVYKQSSNGLSLDTTCVIQRPNLESIDSFKKEALQQGTVLSYSYRLKNQNSLSCQPTKFTLKLSTTYMLEGHLPFSEVTLKSGESIDFSISLTSNISTTIADHLFDLQVQPVNMSSLLVYSGGYYRLHGPSWNFNKGQYFTNTATDTQAPDFGLINKVSSRPDRTSYSVSWNTVADFGGSGVSHYEIWVDGLQRASTQTTSARFEANYSGPKLICLRVVDKVGNFSNNCGWVVK